MSTTQTTQLLPYVLRHADDCLILAQRLGELISYAPELEEDIAIGNLSPRPVGNRPTVAAIRRRSRTISGTPRTTWLSDAANASSPICLLAEQPNGDFAHTMARQFLFDVYQQLLFTALSDSSDTTIAGIAGKAVKECRYHVRHSSSWVIRLGDGTEESHTRMQAGFDDLWRFTGELFIDDDIDEAAVAAGFGVLPSRLRAEWESIVSRTLSEATLRMPDDTAVRTGGRSGNHSEQLGPMLAEMQSHVPIVPGGIMVSTKTAWDVAATVPDPEIPVVNVAELGILRSVDDRRDGQADRDHHPDVFGLSGHRGHQAGDRDRANERRIHRRHGQNRAESSLDNRLDHR